VLEALGWGLLRAFREAGGLDPRPHMLERSFIADLGSWRLRGIIDRVDASDDHAAWRLIDYKTGRPLPASRLRRDLQLALYALGASAGLGLQSVELEIAYLRDGRRVRLEADDDLLEEARRLGAEVAEAVRGARFEPRPERRRCGACAYRMACDEGL
jgi:RecB family exonuclease